MITTNIRNFYKRICKSEEGSIEYLKNLECIKETDVLLLHQFFNKVTNYFDLLARTATPYDVIPKACCAWGLLFAEVQNIYGGLCDAIPGATQFHIDIVQQAIGDALDLVCGRFSSIDNCRKDATIGMDRLEIMEIKAMNHSFLVPLIDIVKLLDSDIDPGKD